MLMLCICFFPCNFLSSVFPYVSSTTINDCAHLFSFSSPFLSSFFFGVSKYKINFNWNGSDLVNEWEEEE